MAYSIAAATEREREAIHGFYEEVCRRLEGEDYGPGWHYGIYPADEDLDVHIRAGEMFCARAEERLAAAMVIVGRDDPIYRDVAWEIREEPIHVLHLLAVHPDFRGSGLAQAMLSFLLERARRMGAKSIHLDVVTGNLPAEKLYRSTGFHFVEEREVWYPDTGAIRVALYEYPLVNS